MYLREMVDVGLHVGHLAELEVDEVEEVAGEGVDLICHRRQRLGREVFGFVQCIALVP
jgi:hypothetical protein